MILRLLRFTAFGLLVSSGIPRSAHPQQPTPPVYLGDSNFISAMNEGKLLERQRRFLFAADAFKKANKIAGGQCSDCLQAEYRNQMSLGSFKAAVATAEQMEALAGNPSSRSVALYERARALLMAAGDKPKPEKLQVVHELLQQAEQINPNSASVLFQDGEVLAQMGKLDDAKSSFAKCVTCIRPGDPGRLRAEHFAEDPELSTHPTAPSFEVTALDGSRFNLDAMGGRVVLIDFWATWCPPCNREIPHLQRVAKDFAGEPLVMISVSLDKDDAKWKDFVAKHEMTWKQYRDVDGKLSNAFGVTTIPRYFTIDADGVLTSVVVDEGADIEGSLRKLLAKAHSAHPAIASADLSTHTAPAAPLATPSKNPLP